LGSSPSPPSAALVSFRTDREPPRWAGRILARKRTRHVRSHNEADKYHTKCGTARSARTSAGSPTASPSPRAQTRERRGRAPQRPGGRAKASPSQHSRRPRSATAPAISPCPRRSSRRLSHGLRSGSTSSTRPSSTAAGCRAWAADRGGDVPAGDGGQRDIDRSRSRVPARPGAGPEHVPDGRPPVVRVRGRRRFVESERAVAHRTETGWLTGMTTGAKVRGRSS